MPDREMVFPSRPPLRVHQNCGSYTESLSQTVICSASLEYVCPHETDDSSTVEWAGRGMKKEK